MDATAPVRELPPELTDQQQKFIESLDTIYRTLHEPDLLGGTIRGIMMELSENPEYRKLIADKDIHTMVRGMRDAMGLARVKKEESKAKRSGGRKSTKKLDDDATLDALKDFDFGDLS